MRNMVHLPHTQFRSCISCIWSPMSLGASTRSFTGWQTNGLLALVVVIVVVVEVVSYWFCVCFWGHLCANQSVLMFQVLWLAMMMTLSLLMTFMMLSAQCLKAWTVTWKMTQYVKSADVCTVHDSSMYYTLNTCINFFFNLTIIAFVLLQKGIFCICKRNVVWSLLNRLWQSVVSNTNHIVL